MGIKVKTFCKWPLSGEGDITFLCCTETDGKMFCKKHSRKLDEWNSLRKLAEAVGEWLKNAGDVGVDVEAAYSEWKAVRDGK